MRKGNGMIHLSLFVPLNLSVGELIMFSVSGRCRFKLRGFRHFLLLSQWHIKAAKAQVDWTFYQNTVGAPGLGSL